MSAPKGLPKLFAPGGNLTEFLLGLIIALAVGFGSIAGQQVSVARFAVGALGGLLFFLISLNGRTTALRLVIIWVVYLGLLRRLLIPLAGWSERDPLLLVAPACALMIWLNGRKGSPTKRDGITFFGLLFLIWTIGQIFNPLQGSVALGAQGALFWATPVLWLFVGRTFHLREHIKLSNLVMWISIPVALHGLYHNVKGLLPFEYTWVGVSGVGVSIFFPGFKIRPFSSLTSPQEYGAFLAVAICFVWATVLMRKRFMLGRVVLFLYLLTALFLQGTRSTFALTLAMIFITTIVWSRNLAFKMAMVGLALGVVGIVKTVPLPTEWGDGGVAAAIERQIAGFQNPEESTAPLHKQMIVDGFETSWKHPLGLGTARTTRAAEKAGQFGGTTEYDMANVFVSFGVPVGAFYLLFMMLVGVMAFRRFRINRTAYSLAALGLPIVVFGNIWNGGLYAVSAILWLTFGGLTRSFEEEAEAEESEPDVPDEPEELDEAA